MKRFQLWVDDIDQGTYTMDDMTRANRDDGEILDFVRTAKVDESSPFGGGAAPVVVIQRIADNFSVCEDCGRRADWTYVDHPGPFSSCGECRVDSIANGASPESYVQHGR